MALRGKVMSILDVVLRVPPVFVMDAILVSGFGGMPRSFFNFDANSTLLSKPAYEMPGTIVNSTPNLEANHTSYQQVDDAAFMKDLIWTSLNFHGKLQSACDSDAV